MTRSGKLIDVIQLECSVDTQKLATTFPAAQRGLWHSFKAGLEHVAQRALHKNAEPALTTPGAIQPELLQCRQPQQDLIERWRQRLPGAYALYCLNGALDSREIQALQQACKTNGLQLLGLSLSPQRQNFPDTLQVFHAAELELDDWLVLHHLASVLLQPVEIRASHLGVVLSAAEVFAKPALQVRSHERAGGSAVSSHPLCTLSDWLHPDLAQLIWQLRDHLNVIAESAALSQKRVQEIWQAEVVSANYQRWYGDILTGKHIAP